MSGPSTPVDESFWGEIDGTEALQRYESLIDAVTDGIYQLDAEGHFVGVNDRIVEATGYSRQELLGEHVSLVLDDSDIERIKQDFRQRLKAGNDIDNGATYETIVETADDGMLTCELQITLLIADGEFRGSVGIVRDITERTQRERHFKGELDEVLGRITDVFYAVDTEWRFTHANERMEELVGMPENEFLGESVWDVFPEFVDTEVYELDHRAMETGDPLSYEIYFEPWDEWFEANLYPSETGMSVYFRVITERKEREQELKQYETAIETIWDGVTILDPDDRFVLVNEGFCEMTGYDREEVIGEPASLFLNDSAYEEAEKLHKEVVAGNLEVATLEYDLQKADGDTIPVEARFGPYEYEGGPAGGVGVIRDISERKERERTLNKYETIVETINDGVYVKDDENRFTIVNDAYADLTGYDREELVGAHASLVVDEATVQQAKAKREATIDTDDVSPTMEAMIETADGNQVPAEGSFATIQMDDGEIEQVGVVRDITERKEAEERRRNSEERFRNLMEHSPFSIQIFDATGKTIAVNPAWERLWDAPKEYLEDYNILQDEQLEDNGVLSHIRKAFAGEDVTLPITHYDPGEIGKPGRKRWIEGYAYPILSEDDATFEVALVHHDITDLKEHEQELEESEARFRLLAENLEEMVWLSDPDTRELLYLNPAYEEIWGRNRESLLDDPRTFLNEVHPNDRDRVEQAYDAVPDESFEEVYRIVRPDGQIRWLNTRAAPVRSEERNIRRVVGITEDITERKEYERALEESERRYRTLVENFPNGAVGLFDEDFEYTAIGGCLLDEVDINKEERIGNSVYEIYPDSLVEEIEQYFKSALDGESNSFEVEFHDRYFYAYTLPVRNADDEIFGGMIVVQDVTERREYQHQLEASNERLQQFAYAASHDLQEPLRMVTSYLQLIEDRYGDVFDEDGEEFFEFAIDGANRMRVMIEGLLEYSRVETQGGSFELINLDDVLVDVCDDLQMRIEESNAEIRTGDLPSVEVDAGQLRRVFQNLLSNAIEYSGDQPPQVNITVEYDDNDWIISIHDEGIGIDPDEQERIFEVFQRLHTHDEHPGTGIGLALCQRIIERHGGEIWVESNPEEGSTFAFTLPATDA